jgi:hypothetical protein
MLDADLVVAIVAAMLNIVLSLLLPSLLKNSHLPFAEQVKKNYGCNRDVIMVSSVLTIIFVYVSLKITPWVRSNVFSNLAKLGSPTK